jgi:L-threonylcarbamoyladenylate synthase
MYLGFGSFGCCSDHSDRFVIILDYNKKNHKQIIHACVKGLKQGKVIAYPTDTSYGLAVDASNIKAIKKLYRVKGRSFNKAVSVVVPSVGYSKKIVKWGSIASKLAKKFWPLLRPNGNWYFVGQAGAITLVLPLKIYHQGLKILSSAGFLGLRMPNNKIALDLAQILKKPITATSANVAGLPDCYSAADVIAQFQNKKFKPDIIINAGKLPTRKPSTIVKIGGDSIQVLRKGMISESSLVRVIR